jgi:ribosome-binding factor A
MIEVVMSSKHPEGPSQRQLRVGEAIRHALADLLERGVLRDPRLAGVSVTVSEVRSSPDLRNATAFVAPLGGGDSDAVVAALSRATPFLRRQIARRVRLRYVPDLRFVADPTFDRASRIEALLAEDEKGEGDRAEDDRGGGDRGGGDHGA